MNVQTDVLLSVRNLTVTLGGREIVRNISFDLHAGGWMMLAGPNGAGKTTILRALTRAVPCGGSVLIGGRDNASLRSRERAHLIGLLEQNHPAGIEYTVRDVIRLGLYSHRGGMFSRLSEADTERRTEEAAERTGMTELLDQPLLTLSGGERQRAFLAQLFAQNPKILLLDEPTNHLDLKYQKQLFELLGGWLGEGERAILSAVHDLSLARAFGKSAVLIDRGETAACGTVGEVLTEERLGAVYGMDVGGWMRTLYGGWNGKEP